MVRCRLLLAGILLLSASVAQADRLRMLTTQGNQEYDGVQVLGVVRDAQNNAFFQVNFPDGKMYPIPAASVLSVVFGDGSTGVKAEMDLRHPTEGQKTVPGCQVFRFSSLSFEARAPGSPQNAYIPLDQVVGVRIGGVTALPTPTPIPTPVPERTWQDVRREETGGMAEAQTHSYVGGEREFLHMSKYTYFRDNSWEWEGRRRLARVQGGPADPESEMDAIVADLESPDAGGGTSSPAMGSSGKAENGVAVALIMGAVGLAMMGLMIAIGLLRNRKPKASAEAASDGNAAY